MTNSNRLEDRVMKAAQSDASATMVEHSDLHLLHVRAMCRIADQMSEIRDSLMHLSDDLAEIRAAIAPVETTDNAKAKVLAEHDAESPLDTRAAAAYLGVNYFTLSRWRAEGRGPEFVQMGTRIVRYRRTALDQFLAAQSIEGQNR